VSDWDYTIYVHIWRWRRVTCNSAVNEYSVVSSRVAVNSAFLNAASFTKEPRMFTFFHGVLTSSWTWRCRRFMWSSVVSSRSTRDRGVLNDNRTTSAPPDYTKQHCIGFTIDHNARLGHCRVLTVIDVRNTSQFKSLLRTTKVTTSANSRILNSKFNKRCDIT